MSGILFAALLVWIHGTGSWCPVWAGRPRAAADTLQSAVIPRSIYSLFPSHHHTIYTIYTHSPCVYRYTVNRLDTEWGEAEAVTVIQLSPELLCRYLGIPPSSPHSKAADELSIKPATDAGYLRCDFKHFSSVSTLHNHANYEAFFTIYKCVFLSLFYGKTTNISHKFIFNAASSSL